MMAKKIIYLIVCLFFLFPYGLALSREGPDEVIRLKEGEYSERLLELISQARESIYVQMYLMTMKADDPKDPVAELIDALIETKDRGVAVKVILEDSKFQQNYDAYKRLAVEGVEVDFDSPLSILHRKVTVIDGKFTVIGSTNWTRAAFSSNLEASVLIHSEEIARGYIEDFLKIKKRKGLPDLPSESMGVKLSSVLLTSKDKLPRLFSSHSEKAFDLYLLLLKKAQELEADVIPVDYEELAKALHYTKPESGGLRPTYAEHYWYFSLRQPMKKLVERYGLIKHRPWSKELEVISVGEEGDYFILPYEYWEYRLDKRLSFRAKMAYLISIVEAGKSARNPYWFRSQEDLSKIYHIGERRLTDAISELEEEDILEVYRHVPEDLKDFSKRPANNYRLNSLSSPEEFQRSLKALSKRHGQGITKRAKRLSAQLNEPKDLEDIETFIALIKKYGYEKVKSANSKTSKYRRESGLRDISTTIRLLK